MKTRNGEQGEHTAEPLPADLRPPTSDFRLDRLKAENKMLRDGLKARGIDPDLLLRVLRKSPNTKSK